MTRRHFGIKCHRQLLIPQTWVIKIYCHEDEFRVKSNQINCREYPKASDFLALRA